MNKDEIFVAQHKKAMGEEKARKMLEDVKKAYKSEEKPKKVYISVYGGEVHVNGPVVVQVEKPETLAEKIARFERLAETVRANRSLMSQLAHDIISDDEEDINDDSLLDDVEDLDAFGEPVQKVSVAEHKDSTPSGSDSDDVGHQPQVIEGDEPSKTADGAQPSDMPSQE